MSDTPIMRTVRVRPSNETGDADDACRWGNQIDARFRAPLMTYFYRRVRSHTEAQDLTQEVFLRLVTRTRTSSPVVAAAYVFTIAANLLRDRARRAVSHRADAHQSLDLPTGLVAAELVEEIEPERVLLGCEDLQFVLDALAELDERTRSIFMLFRVERIRQREIAAMYGMTVGAVEKRILKASTHLIACLKKRQTTT